MATDKQKSIEFLASIPHVAGAVDFHGSEGTRLILDIPEQYKPDAIHLPVFYLNKVLRVKITIEQ